MKNVAKCDTWCELQNPVNHRVFERKLRSRPSGRGHACLGVTPSVAPPPPPASRSAAGDAEIGPPCLARGGLKRRAPVRGDGTTSGGWMGAARPRRSAPRVDVVVPPPRAARAPPSNERENPARALRRVATRRRPRLRPQVRRGHPLSLSISISGGKETYEDSPSNGERTGNSPA